MRKSFFSLAAWAAPVVLVGLSGLLAGCGGHAQMGCTVDDDCRAYACDGDELPVCGEGGMCSCGSSTELGDVGRYSAMALLRGDAYICAYNNTYGDLMIGHQPPPGRVTNWEFVDGVPLDSPSDNPLSPVRGGITDPGDDVGRYCSIQVTIDSDPVMSYYDGTDGALKYASFGAVRWHEQFVDRGVGKPTKGGDDIGRWTSLTLGKDGSPGIAYYAEIAKGPMTGKRESQLRFAQAKNPQPQGPTDWVVTVIESQPMPDTDPKNPPPLPEGVALFVASARKSDGSPVIAYYDRVRGNLKYVEFDPASNRWNDPIILDGEDGAGNDTGDVGQYPSVFIDQSGVSHISYVDATHDNLLYVNSHDLTPEVVDDGYRPMDETTLDGLPSPVYHLVGDSSSIQIGQGQVVIAYQDSTVEQLRAAVRDPMTGTWAHKAIAGHDTPFRGSYGFYAQNRVNGGQAVLSSYGINQHLDNPDYFVEIFAVSLGEIIQ